MLYKVGQPSHKETFSMRRLTQLLSKSRSRREDGRDEKTSGLEREGNHRGEQYQMLIAE